MHDKSLLTDKTFMDANERRRALEEISKRSAKTAQWLGYLLDREKRLTTDANAYSERYTRRQYGLAVAPIVRRELIRARILAALSDKNLSLEQIAETLKIQPSEVMPHVVALRRRGQMAVERMEQQTTPIYKAIEQTEES